MLWALSQRQPALFSPLLAACLSTDLLDGYLARRWQVQSRLGAVLDTTADVGGLGCAAVGLAVFHPALVGRHAVLLALLGGAYVLAHTVSLAVRSSPATFAGSLGRPAMAAMATFASALAFGIDFDGLLYLVVALGTAAAVQDLYRVTRPRSLALPITGNTPTRS